MTRTATLTLVALIALAARVPALADGDHPADKRSRPETRDLQFDDYAQASNFAGALAVLTETNPDGAAVTARAMRDGTLRLTGSAEFHRHLSALVGRPLVVLRPDREVAPESTTKRKNREQRARREVPPEPGPPDTKVPGRRTRRGAGQRPRIDLEVRVFDLMFADARTLEDYVAMLKVGTTAPWATAYDERTNSIIVKGPAELVAEAAQLIDRLDRPVDDRREPPKVIRLMPLSHAEARELAAVVSELFDVRRGRSGGPLEVVADFGTNTIILAGPERLVVGACDLIARLDTKPKPAPRPKKPQANQSKGGTAKPAKAKDQSQGPKAAAKGDQGKPEAAKAKKDKNKQAKGQATKVKAEPQPGPAPAKKTEPVKKAPKKPADKQAGKAKAVKKPKAAKNPMIPANPAGSAQPDLPAKPESIQQPQQSPSEKEV